MSYLSSNQLKQYKDEGFVSPINIFTKEKAKEIRNEIELIESRIPGELEKSGRYNAHLISPLLDEVTHNSKILDSVESLIGKNILVCGTTLFIKNQNENDLRKAIDFCKINKLYNINIIGATGAREDHTLGNIFSINNLDINFNIKLFTDTGCFTAINKPTLIRSFPKQKLSLFSEYKHLKITTYGLKYNLNNDTINTLFYGTLNESIGNNYKRIKIGIGHPGSKTLVSKYVLEKFLNEERNIIDNKISKLIKYFSLIFKDDGLLLTKISL